MNVLQHTRNKRNLFFKPDRPDRNYRDRLLMSGAVEKLNTEKRLSTCLRVFFVQERSKLLGSASEGHYIKNIEQKMLNDVGPCNAGIIALNSHQIEQPSRR